MTVSQVHSVAQAEFAFAFRHASPIFLIPTCALTLPRSARTTVLRSRTQEKADAPTLPSTSKALTIFHDLCPPIK